MSIKEIWGRLRHWQKGGIIGVVIGIIHAHLIMNTTSLNPWFIFLLLPVVPIFFWSYGSLDILGNYQHALFSSLLTFVSIGIIFGESYFQWKISNEPFWQSENWASVFLILFILIYLINLYLFFGLR